MGDALQIGVKQCGEQGRRQAAHEDPWAHLSLQRHEEVDDAGGASATRQGV